MSIKTKLIIAFGGLIAILGIVGALTLHTLNESSQAIDRILRENYDSVAAGYKMQDALERLDRLAEVSLGEKRHNLNRQHEQALGDFEKNLAFQQGNVTVPGEQEVTDQLTQLWRAYRRELENFYQISDARQQSPPAYRQTLLPLSREVKNYNQRIIELNLENMVSADGQAHRKAVQTRNAMVFLLIIGITGATGFIVLVGPMILEPIATLTRSVREIQKGNLDLVVNVHGKDEVAQLSQAFNDMAAGLRELRRSDRAKLLRTQRSTQLALNSLNDAVAICNPDGLIEVANEAARRLFGLEPESTVTKAGNDKITQMFIQVLQEERPFHPKSYDAVIQIFQEQEELFFLPQAIPIFAEGRQLIGVTLMLTDVTRLRHLDELKSGLISTVSHELKTPLTSIRLAIHVLLSEKLGTFSPKQLELLEVVRQDSDRLFRVIENLLDLSRLESGRAEMQLQRLDVEDLFLQVTDKMRSAFVDRGVGLHMEASAEVPPVLADPVSIQHVFDNLLTNALKYTPRGGQVKLSATPAGDMVRFTVEDTGSGIPPEYLPRLFEKFFRVPGQDQVDSGLGLSIAKEFVEAQGGAIEVASQVGKGTRFTFTLKALEL
jgi:signal transduction histidine kinase/HAMP domain-containing protein